MSPISMFPPKTPPSAAEHAATTAKAVAEGAPAPQAAAPPPTPAPAVVTPPVQKIPLMCTMCGNQLSSIYNAKTKTFTHIHQVTNNAPKCPVTGKKFHINKSHEVEEVTA